MQKKFWYVAVAALLIAASTAGCGNSSKKHSAEAQGRWNRARAGVMLSLARDQFKAGSLEQCRKNTDAALRLDPKNAQLYVLSAKLRIEQGQLELAERELQQARKLSPKDGEPFYLSGVVYQRWQKPQTAYEFYVAASDRSPAELAYVMAQGEMLVDLERTEEALTLLKGKVQYFENSAAIRDAVGQILTQMGRHAEAVDMFRSASILAEDDMNIKERLALSLFHARQYAEAATLLGKLVAEEPYAGRPDLLAALGDAQLQTGKPRDARHTYEAATEKEPSSAQLWLGLGRAAMECKDFRRAELALRKAQALEPKSPEAQLLAGYVRLRQNRLD
ncbi:MAG TPA: tetratricopeptide repeat protein, partial [Tepidisphaeraceae bacterium]|nr:tetratricopeptide repeat protein [Tepidisphaeraceae bacterium]